MQSPSKQKDKFLRGKKLLITAGPTIEPLDPIRFITNHSTGLMGYTIADEGIRSGAEVCLVSGPVTIDVPRGVNLIKVDTAREMLSVVRENVDRNDCLIMTAAVSDFRPAKKATKKIKKAASLTLKMVKNPDILEKIKGKKHLVKVGFALETEHALEHGKKKLKEKGLDLIVINAAGKGKSPFGPGNNDYIILNDEGIIKKVKNGNKRKMAGLIIKEVGRIL